MHACNKSKDHPPTPPKRASKSRSKRSRPRPFVSTTTHLATAIARLSYHLIPSPFLPLQRQTMLASPFYYQSQQPPTYHHQTREFLPKIPSPLSPRSANINGSVSSSNGNRPHQPNFMNSANSDASTTKPQNSSFSFSAPAQQPLPYSKRAIKRAPTVSQDALTERRRGMFLRKVREGREDKRFERHGEDVSISRYPLVLCMESGFADGFDTRSCVWISCRGRRSGRPNRRGSRIRCLWMRRKRRSLMIKTEALDSRVRAAMRCRCRRSGTRRLRRRMRSRGERVRSWRSC